MVVWCTQNDYQGGNSFTWHQPCNNQTALYVHHFGGYSKTCCVQLVTDSAFHATTMQWICSKAENSPGLSSCRSEALRTHLQMRWSTDVHVCYIHTERYIPPVASFLRSYFCMSIRMLVLSDISLKKLWFKIWPALDFSWNSGLAALFKAVCKLNTTSCDLI